jgi:ketosteroid isomerase-like protein
MEVKMKSIHVNISVLVLISLISFGCTLNKTTANIEAEKQAIRDLYNDRYYKGVNDKDLELFITAWADDATRMEPEFFPIVGKGKIKSHFRNIFEGSLEVEIKQYGDVEIEVENDLAFTRGAVTIKGVSAIDSSEVFLDIKFLDIVKKQADGTWEIYIDCVNYNPDISKEPHNEDPREDKSPDPAL